MVSQKLVPYQIVTWVMMLLIVMSPIIPMMMRLPKVSVVLVVLQVTPLQDPMGLKQHVILMERDLF